METGIFLSQADIKKLIAKALDVNEKQIIPSKYSFMVTGVPAENIKKSLESEG